MAVHTHQGVPGGRRAWGPTPIDTPRKGKGRQGCGAPHGGRGAVPGTYTLPAQDPWPPFFLVHTSHTEAKPSSDTRAGNGMQISRGHGTSDFLVGPWNPANPRFGALSTKRKQDSGTRPGAQSYALYCLIFTRMLRTATRCRVLPETHFQVLQHGPKAQPPPVHFSGREYEITAAGTISLKDFFFFPAKW